MPENFIIEFDIIPDAEYYSGISLIMYHVENYLVLNDSFYTCEKGMYIRMDLDAWDMRGYINDPDIPWVDGRSETNPVLKEKQNHVIVWVQKRRVRVYHNGAKTIDMPTVLPAGHSSTDLCLHVGIQHHILIYQTLKLPQHHPICVANC